MKDPGVLHEEEKPGVINGVTGRHGFAHQFAAWLEKNGFQPGKECVVERDASKKYYRICWSVGVGEIGGEVHVYGPTWIRVSWDGDVEYMPMKGSRIFDLDFVAESFMLAAFKDKNWERASLSPEKQTKRHQEQR